MDSGRDMDRYDLLTAFDLNRNLSTPIYRGEKRKGFTVSGENRKETIRQD